MGDARGGQFPTWILSKPEHCLLLLLLLMGVATAEVDKLNRFVESAAEATFVLLEVMVSTTPSRPSPKSTPAAMDAVYARYVSKGKVGGRRIEPRHPFTNGASQGTTE